MANKSKGELVVMCCFSGEGVLESRAVKITVCPPNSDEQQLLFAKASEFCKRILPDIPVHPDITDLADKEGSTL